MDAAKIRIEYYTGSGNLHSYKSTTLSNYPKVSTWWDDGAGINHYYNVYVVDQTLGTDNGAGGFFLIKIDVSELENKSKNYAISSLRVGAYADNMPEHCPIPNANAPQPTPILPTPTPPPTWTPDPGWQTPTPIYTPLPTSAGTTPQPTPTAEPITFPTTQAEWTPTPWPPYTIPTVAWPTAGPTYMAGGIPTLESSGLGLDILADEISDNWGGALASSESGLDATITDTTGIAPPETIAVKMVEDISKPIAYAKTIGVYMPNTAPYITAFLWLAAWVVFSRNARLFLSIAVKLFELLRRVWEMIPFIG
jgi:hypothetical protein